MNQEVMKNDLHKMKAFLGGNYGCGWMCDDVALFLYSLIKFYSPALVIQTGHLWGKSARFILEALTDNASRVQFEEGVLTGDPKFFQFTQIHAPKKIKGNFISIDPNMFNLNDAVFDYLKNKFDNFTLFKTSSDDFFAHHKELIAKEYADSVIVGVVDGDHTVEGCRGDLCNLADIGAKLIIVDDTIWLPYLETCCREFSESHNYDFVSFNLYNGLGVLVKK